jgi:O-antigen/teichoic acid export membrane protein
MLGYSTNTMLYSWGEMIQAQAATILVGVLVGVSRVPEYSIPLLLTALVSRVVTTMSTPIKPEVSRLEALGEMDRVGQLYLAVTRYGLLAILPMATFLLSYGDAVLRIWLGESFLEASPTILAILTIGVGVRLWHVPGYQVVAGLGRHRRFGALALSTGLVSVLLASALHVFLGLGAVGVAIGFALSEALVGLFFVTPYCCVAAGLRLREEATQSLLPALCALVPFAVAVAVARLIFHPEGYAGLVGLVAVLGTVGLLATWFLGLQAEERLRIRRFWMNFGQSSQG